MGRLSARTALLGAGLLVCAATPSAAQSVDTVQRSDTLSYADAGAVAFLYNQPAALRSSSSVEVTRDQTIDGNVAVLGAPLLVAGHITGHAVVINGDVTILPSGRIDGDLVTTGGTVRGADSSTVGGTLRLYAPRMAYRVEADQIVALHDESEGIAKWFHEWKRRFLKSQNRIVLKGGTYNRVEGLPILLGPTIRQNSRIGRFTADAYGIYRSADHFTWKADNLGYRLRGEMQFGFRRSIAVGVDAHDVVEPAEPWQLRDSEIGLASFFLRRDYRDYYNRKGAAGYVALRDGTRAALTLSLGEERWQPRAARDPFTLFRSDVAWRPNPVLDAGTFHLAAADFTYDTRNDVDNPWTGWLIRAQVEHGWSPSVTLGSTAPLVRAPSDGPVPVSYTRGLLDARRYNRVSPDGLLALRLLLGGWLGGDALPLERRFSLGGPGSLPGYDFRQPLASDVLTCGSGSSIPGTPAQCDRVALLQMEYRHTLHLHLFGEWDAQSGSGGWSWSFYHPLQWVAFADAGRGWLRHETAPDGTTENGPAFPSLDTFRTDIGVGLDAEVIGVFVAKSLSDWGNGVHLEIRLRHRF